MKKLGEIKIVFTKDSDGLFGYDATSDFSNTNEDDGLFVVAVMNFLARESAANNMVPTDMLNKMVDDLSRQINNDKQLN